MTLERRDKGPSLSHLAGASASLRAMLERSVAILVTALAIGSLAGCGSKEQVMTSVRVEAPMLTVTGNQLVTDVTGAFVIVLSLGDRAADPTTIDLGAFSLQRDGNVLLDPLLLDADPRFPIDLDVGTSRRVSVTIANPDEDPSLAAELCAGELSIVGTVTDSLVDDRPRTLSSGPFSPDCP
jgi:hypothetical protein